MKYPRIGHGIDVHRFGEGDSVTLAGVKIAHNQGLIAHSDGDVALHALCDALLGALALGDIGKHFPDTDIAYKNIFNQLKLHSFGVFSLHGILTANFLAIPIIFKSLGMSGSTQGGLYVAVFLMAVMFMGPLLAISERKRCQKEIIIFVENKLVFFF